MRLESGMVMGGSGNGSVPLFRASFHSVIPLLTHAHPSALTCPSILFPHVEQRRQPHGRRGARQPLQGDQVCLAGKDNLGGDRDGLQVSCMVKIGGKRRVEKSGLQGNAGESSGRRKEEGISHHKDPCFSLCPSPCPPSPSHPLFPSPPLSLSMSHMPLLHMQAAICALLTLMVEGQPPDVPGRHP